MANRAKRGRPAELKNSRTCNVRMGQDHWDRLTKLAEVAGCSRSEWIRRAIMRGRK